jgi:hypothetical protein
LPADELPADDDTHGSEVEAPRFFHDPDETI